MVVVVDENPSGLIPYEKKRIAINAISTGYKEGNDARVRTDHHGLGR